MTLRREYSLGHSEYNAFLFASVGEEKIGMPLTVLTALTRLGVDPWLEAARLADLSKEAALQAFTATIARLPEGDWKATDAGAIAARLLKWLPGKSAPVLPPARAVHRSIVPPVAGVSTVNLPPACCARSCMFVRPLLLVRSEMPRPLSTTSIHTSSSTLTVTVSVLA